MMKNKWRLPTLYELFSAFDHEKGRPGINGFNLDYYWSSTIHSDNTDNAWIVYFRNGHTGYDAKDFTYYVRCVKKKKNGKLKWSKSSKNKMTWEEANKYCEEMNRTNKWELPAVTCLQNAFDYEKDKPKIDGFISDYYWSSTVNAEHTKLAWIVNFNSGYTHRSTKSYTNYVRCMRRNKNGEIEWSKSSKDKMTWKKACKYCKGVNNE